jgi:curved DNA-binding protein
MAEDYYKTLEVNRNASQADIQKAYRDMARKYHPDRNPSKDATKKFQAIQKAFEVLNDPQKRELYDRYGSSFENIAAGAGGPRGGPAWSGTGAPGGGFGGFPGFEEVDFSQFFGDRYANAQGSPFGDMFGQQARRPGAKPRRGAAGRRRGTDVESEMTIPFNTSILGGEVQIMLPRPDGHVETIAVKIPPGIEDGKKIRLRGQGEMGPSGGEPGDLLVKIHVAPHPHFQRKGDVLLVRVPVTLAEAAAGGKVDVPTPKGTVALKIPPGTSSGTRLRIKGHGIAKDDSPGDLLAEILIVLPKDLDSSDQEAIRRIDEKHPLNPRSELQW